MIIPSREPTPESDAPASTERPRRVPPPRQAPLRSALGAPHPGPPACADDERARSEVEASVETAYHVYEEYMRWGQATAAQRTSSTDWSRPMTSNSPDPRAFATQWTQMLQEMYRLWMAALMPVMPNVPGMSPPGPTSSPSPFPPAPGSGRTEPGRPLAMDLDLDLSTSQPTRVRIQLVRDPPAGPWKVWLYQKPTEGPGSIEVTFVSGGIRVEPLVGHPAGSYSGVIQDGDGQLCGMMSIHLGDSA